MAFRIQIVGVGGHGVILVARVLSQCAADAGMHCVMSEVHGMSQRGGIVHSSVVIDGGDAPLIGTGQADLLVASEAGEALRQGGLLKAGGTLVLNELTVLPPHMVGTDDAYPSVDEVTRWFTEHGFRVWRVQGSRIAEDAGSIRVMNSAMLGTIVKSGVLPFDMKQMTEALITVTRGRLREKNIAALHRGFEECRMEAL